MKHALAFVWRRLRPVQWRLLWLVNATFMIGVCGVVRDEYGQVLLLRHRLWPAGRDWGVPTGYAKRGELLEDTVAREVREETGLHVEATRLLQVRSGYRLRVEVAYEARLIGGELELDPLEVVDAQWFEHDNLPHGLQPGHRDLIQRA